jgi:hypothetical protein
MMLDEIVLLGKIVKLLVGVVRRFWNARQQVRRFLPLLLLLDTRRMAVVRV